MVILKLQNISKSFGERKLFYNLSFDLEAGKIYSLIGANGSGKTTLFNILTGFVKPDSGKIVFKGKEINKKPPYKINRLGIARTFQDLRIINNLTVTENVLMVLEKKMFHFATDNECQQVESILNSVSLNLLGNSLACDLSYGQQKLLTLGCCLASNPELLLLDEPIAGIDKENNKRIKEIVLRLVKQGKTILQIEHNLEYIKSTSSTMFSLENGQLITLSNG